MTSMAFETFGVANGSTHSGENRPRRPAVSGGQHRFVVYLCLPSGSRPPVQGPSRPSHFFLVEIDRQECEHGTVRDKSKSLVSPEERASPVGRAQAASAGQVSSLCERFRHGASPERLGLCPFLAPRLTPTLASS